LGTLQGALPGKKGQDGNSLSWQQNSTVLKLEQENSLDGLALPSHSKECGVFPSA
jgi:hypothetical protein